MYNNMYISWWVYFVTGLNLVPTKPSTAVMAKTKADIAKELLKMILVFHRSIKGINSLSQHFETPFPHQSFNPHPEKWFWGGHLIFFQVPLQIHFGNLSFNHLSMYLGCHTVNFWTDLIPFSQCAGLSEKKLSPNYKPFFVFCVNLCFSQFYSIII